MTVHLNRRALPPPPAPTADDRRELREALKIRLHFLDRDIAEHELGIASAEADPSPLGRKELALRKQLLPGLRAERRCVARRLDAITPEPLPTPVRTRATPLNDPAVRASMRRRLEALAMRRATR